MLVEILYAIAIALFAFVVFAAAQLPSGILLVISLVPVFMALVVGCMMWLVALSEFGLMVAIGSLAVPLAAAFALRRLSDRNLFIAVWVAAALAAAVAYAALSLADTA